MPFTPEEADNQLKQAWAEGPEQWQRAVNTLLLDIFKAMANTRGHVGRHERFLRGLASKMVAEQPGGAGADAGGAGAGGTAGDGPMVGADGAPLDEAAAEAERQMNAAAGPRAAIGGAPAAPAPARPIPGGVRVGADGTPADPALAAAEEAMEAAAGPRE